MTRVETMETVDRSKLDAMVNQWFDGGLDSAASMPLVIYCKPNTEQQVSLEIERRGGRIRHALEELHAVSAWVSRDTAIALAVKPSVSCLEMVQTFDIL